MEFAVLDDKRGRRAPAKAGEALIAREDLEGLDLQEGAKVPRVPRRTAPGTALTLTVQARTRS